MNNEITLKKFIFFVKFIQSVILIWNIAYVYKCFNDEKIIFPFTKHYKKLYNILKKRLVYEKLTDKKCRDKRLNTRYINKKRLNRKNFARANRDGN